MAGCWRLDGREKHVKVLLVQQNETKDLYLKQTC